MQQDIGGFQAVAIYCGIVLVGLAIPWVIYTVMVRTGRWKPPGEDEL